MEVDGIIRILIVALLGFGMFLGWLLLLAGVSALQNVCPNNCREVVGLNWWIVWFQFLVYLISVPVQFGKIPIAKLPTLFFLAVLATLEMLQADRLLDLKDSRSFGHTPRINATVAGHSVLAAFNVLTILFVGLVPYEDDDVSDQEGGSNNQRHTQVPMPPSIPGAHPMKPMTSRASSMRASSPPASEASYPAVPGR